MHVGSLCWVTSLSQTLALATLTGHSLSQVTDTGNTGCSANCPRVRDNTEELVDRGNKPTDQNTRTRTRTVSGPRIFGSWPRAGTGFYMMNLFNNKPSTTKRQQSYLKLHLKISELFNKTPATNQ